MKKLIIIAVVVAQIGVLGWMAVEREWVLRTGRIVYLRTAPVDPKDPMRGDYVRLSYELATVPKKLCRDGILKWFDSKETIYNSKTRDRRVYAQIKLDEDGVAELVSLSDRVPTDGLFLRGRADAIYLSTLQVRFGVEAFFMQQGKARKFEDTMRGEKAGVPLNMEIAVSPSGLAVLKGYRSEPLGIIVTPDRIPTETNADRRTPPPRGLRGVTVELKNHGTTPLAIVDESATHSLRLVPSLPRWRLEDQSGWAWVGENRLSPKTAASEVKVLQPGESHRVHLDFTTREWFVRKIEPNKEEGPAVSLETLAGDWTASFRIEYAPPSKADCIGLPQAELIRHGKLPSRQFSASGGGD